MSNAFKCDRCDDFEKGSPERFIFSEYSRVNEIGNWVGQEVSGSWELCESCSNNLKGLISAWENEELSI